MQYNTVQVEHQACLINQLRSVCPLHELQRWSLSKSTSLDLIQVRNKWGTAGTIADMRMTAATWTLLSCYNSQFKDLAGFLLGNLGLLCRG